MKKESTRTLLCGQGWRRFIREKNLTKGEMIHFNLAAQVPRINIIYLNFGGDEDEDEEKEEEEEEVEEEEDDDAALAATLFAQRCNLTEHEQYHLLEILPPLNTYIGVPFVTRLSSTNVNRNTMGRFFQLICFSSFCCCVHA